MAGAVGLATLYPVIARSEATKQSILPLWHDGLLRCARNDGESVDAHDGFRCAPPILLRPQLPLVGRIVRLIDGELVHRGLPEMLGQSRRLQIDFAASDLLAERSVQFNQRAIR